MLEVIGGAALFFVLLPVAIVMALMSLGD